VKYEASTDTRFLRLQAWPTADGDKETWRCNRSWREADSDQFERPNRSIPTIKLGTQCVCTLETTISPDGIVTCCAYPLHNHWVSPSDLRSRQLSAETRTFVSSLSAMGLSDNAIIAMVRGDVLSWENRNEFDSACTRDTLLTKQDIRNVKRLQFQQLDPCDTTSFEMMIRRLQAQEDGPVRFYKGPGQPARFFFHMLSADRSDPHLCVGRDGLKSEEWCLVLSTRFMLDELERNVSPPSRTACLDVVLTHLRPVPHRRSLTTFVCLGNSRGECRWYRKFHLATLHSAS
jgi:hypothetical protein